MKKQELIDWAVSRGFEKDKFGHMQKTRSDGKVLRLKIQPTSVQYEIKSKIGNHNEWLRLFSGYYKNLTISENGKLTTIKKENENEPNG